MTELGDYEPEDAWDAADPVELLALNLRRRLILYIDTDDRTADRAMLRRDEMDFDFPYAIGRAHDAPETERELLRLAAAFSVMRE
jgi:uncharacterized iron-regulated protein